MPNCGHFPLGVSKTCLPKLEIASGFSGLTMDYAKRPLLSNAHTQPCNGAIGMVTHGIVCQSFIHLNDTVRG